MCSSDLGGIEARLRGHLERGSFIYTPCLGVAYALAQIDYIGACAPQPMGEKEVRVDTVVPWAGEEMELNLAESGGDIQRAGPLQADDGAGTGGKHQGRVRRRCGSSAVSAQKGGAACHAMCRARRGGRCCVVP